MNMIAVVFEDALVADELGGTDRGIQTLQI